MPSQQIQVRWNSNQAEDYAASVNALNQYEPLPTIKVSLNIKGQIPQESLEEIIAIGQEHMAEIGLTLTGTWEKDDVVTQLRLWEPDRVGRR